MDDNRGASAGIYRSLKLSAQKKYLVFTLFVLVLLFLFSGGFGLVKLLENNSIIEVDNFCGDGTFYDSCSTTKPYFCQDGKFIELSSVCGCPEGFGRNNNSCVSAYQTNPKWISLDYTLHGQSYSLDFVVYKGFENYISSIPRSITYSPNSNSSRADFVLKAIDEQEQRKFLMPLVVQIQNITNDKDDQMRIAVSLVQNIPFGYSNKTYYFGSTKVNYSRYPYDVLYDVEGICGEKTDLLAFLLREMGYSLASFYYPKENHEALGIKCPVRESLMKSEYCFVETTGPAIITDNKIFYIGVGKLISTPEVYPLSYGKSIGINLEEYDDAEELIRIRSSIEKTGLIGPIKKKVFERIKIKYGLADEYYG
jgi:hypothetical protein